MLQRVVSIVIRDEGGTVTMTEPETGVSVQGTDRRQVHRELVKELDTFIQGNRDLLHRLAEIHQTHGSVIVTID